MATLQGISGASLVPNTGAIVRQIADRFRQQQQVDIKKAEAEAATQTQIDLLNQAQGLNVPSRKEGIPELQTPFDAILGTIQKEFGRLSELAPEFSKAVQQVISSGDPEQIDLLGAEGRKGAEIATKILREPDFAAKQRSIQKLATEAIAKGEDPERFINPKTGLMNLSEAQLDNELMGMRIKGKDLESIANRGRQAALNALSVRNPAAAKLFIERTAPKETFTEVLNEAGEVVGMRSSLTNQVETDPRAVARLKREQITSTAELARERITSTEGIAKRSVASKERLAALKPPPAREQKILDIMATNPGITRAQASNVANGVVKVVTDRFSGQSSLVNTATGTSTPIGRGATTPIAASQGPAQPPSVAPATPAATTPAQPPAVPFAATATPPQEQTAFDVLGIATGLVPNVQAFLSGPGGQLSDELVAEDVIQARTKIRSIKDKLITALSQGGRVSNQEQTRILENIPSLGVFESPGQARAQLTQLHSTLSRRVIVDTEIMNDPTQSIKERQEANKRVNGITAVLAEIGPPPADSGGIPQVNTRSEYDALPAGTEYTDSRGRKGIKR